MNGRHIGRGPIHRSVARHIARGAIIAALYVVLTLVNYSFAYGAVQVRLSEALCVLPLFTPVAIPGLFVGCVISNLFGGLGVWDVVIGSLATLAASGLTYAMRRLPIWASISPAVIVNAIVIGSMIVLLSPEPLSVWLTMGGVGLGQLIACYGLGVPLALLIRRRANLRRLLA